MWSYDRVHCHQLKALCNSLHLGGSHLYTAGKEVALIYSLEEHQRTPPSILMNGLQKRLFMYGLRDNHETGKINDPECHNTATCKVSDDEKPCRRPLKIQKDHVDWVTFLKRTVPCMSVAAKEVEWHMNELFWSLKPCWLSLSSRPVVWSLAFCAGERFKSQQGNLQGFFFLFFLI